MEIEKITRDMFPLFIVQSRAKGLAAATDWRRFTVTPFRQYEDALRHLEKCREEYSESGEFQVTEYTPEQWRQDLLDAVMQDPDAIRRGLSVLRTETLADLLK